MKQKTQEDKQIIFPEKWNLIQLAGLLRMDRRTISEKLIKSRVPFSDGPRNSKLYNLDDVLKCMYSKPVSQNETGEFGDEELTELDEEKLLLTKAKRETAELILAEKRKEVVPIGDVLEELSKEYTFVRTQLRALPSRLAKHLANEADPEEVFNLLSGAIEDTLNELQADSIQALEKISGPSPEEIEAEKNKNTGSDLDTIMEEEKIEDKAQEIIEEQKEENKNNG